LHPWQFLPDGLSLVRRHLTEDPPRNVSYIITEDGRLRATADPNNTDAPEFPIEPQHAQRADGECLNVWLLLLNAYSKFVFFRNRYEFEGLPGDIQEVVQLTIDIVTLLYTDPTPTSDAAVAASTGSRWTPRGVGRKGYREDKDPSDREGRGGPAPKAGEAGLGAGTSLGLQGRCEFTTTVPWGLAN
jgi:hypothetical protein